MMRATCTAREDWPRYPYRRACLCQRCRTGTIDRLADQSLSAALAHAQNRGEAPYPEGSATEDTLGGDIPSGRSPRMRLDIWLRMGAAQPGRTMRRMA